MFSTSWWLNVVKPHMWIFWRPENIPFVLQCGGIGRKNWPEWIWALSPEASQRHPVYTVGSVSTGISRWSIWCGWWVELLLPLSPCTHTLHTQVAPRASEDSALLSHGHKVGTNTSFLPSFKDHRSWCQEQLSRSATSCSLCLDC